MHFPYVSTTAHLFLNTFDLLIHKRTRYIYIDGGNTHTYIFMYVYIFIQFIYICSLLLYRYIYISSTFLHHHLQIVTDNYTYTIPLRRKLNCIFTDIYFFIHAYIYLRTYVSTIHVCIYERALGIKMYKHVYISIRERKYI